MQAAQRFFRVCQCSTTNYMSVCLLQNKVEMESSGAAVPLSTAVINLQSQIMAKFVDKLSKIKAIDKIISVMELSGSQRQEIKLHCLIFFTCH